MTIRTFQDRAVTTPPMTYRSGSGPVSGPESAAPVTHTDPAATVIAECNRR
jgi:hypothetical protein